MDVQTVSFTLGIVIKGNLYIFVIDICLFLLQTSVSKDKSCKKGIAFELTNFRRIQTTQNKALRLALNKLIDEQTGVTTVYDYVPKEAH